MNVSLLFNSSQDFSMFFNQMSSYVTGSDTLSLVIILALLLVVAFMFRMPEVLVIVALAPIVMVFAFIDPNLWVVYGLFLIVAGAGLFAIFRR
jgi:hypothetical protein